MLRRQAKGVNENPGTVSDGSSYFESEGFSNENLKLIIKVVRVGEERGSHKAEWGGRAYLCCSAGEEGGSVGRPAIVHVPLSISYTDHIMPCQTGGQSLKSERGKGQKASDDPWGKPGSGTRDVGSPVKQAAPVEAWLCLQETELCDLLLGLRRLGWRWAARARGEREEGKTLQKAVTWSDFEPQKAGPPTALL